MRKKGICSPLASSNSRVPQEQGALPTISFAIMTPSEFAAPIAGPAFHHNLGLGIELHAVVGLGVKIAEETLAPTTKGERGDRRGDAHVDTDVAGVDFVAEAAGVGAIGSEDARHVAIGALVDKGDGFVDGGGVHETEDGSEDFDAGDFPARRDLVEDRGEDEEASLVAGDRAAATVHQK